MRLRMCLLCVAVSVVVAGCTPPIATGVPPTITTAPPTVTSPLTPPSPQGVGLTTERAAHFGWTGAGEVTYSIGTDSDLRWYLYDPATGLTRETDPQLPSLPPEVLDQLTEQGSVEVLQTSISPSGDTILYRRRPAGYVAATVTGFDVKPAELWLAEDQGRRRTRLYSDFGGHHLAPSSVWVLEETLVLASFIPYHGSVVHFLLDVREHTVDELVFGANSGVWCFEPALSADGSWLACATLARQLWALPVRDVARSRTEGPDDDYRLSASLDDTFRGPAWSPDGRWLYYWRQPRYRADRATYPPTLERVDVSSGQGEVVLGEDDLARLLGAETYARLGSSSSLVPAWALSPDGRQALLEVRRTVPSAPHTLWLVSW